MGRRVAGEGRGLNPLAFVVVCEAAADRETACGYADRVILDAIEWVELEYLDSIRTWRGLEPGETYLRWGSIREKCRARRIKLHGHFDNQPADFDAHAGRRALLLIKSMSFDLDAVVLVRDSDGKTAIARGLEQARAEAEAKTTLLAPILLGIAHPKRESWVLAGFEALNQDEFARIEAARRELGFHPCEQPESLTASHDHDKKSAKRVLEAMKAGVAERESTCWNSGELGPKRERGRLSGLDAFLRRG